MIMPIDVKFNGSFISNLSNQLMKFQFTEHVYYKATLRLTSYHSDDTSHTEWIDVSDLGEDSHSDKTLNFTQEPLPTFLWADYLHSLVLEMELIQYLHRTLFQQRCVLQFTAE